MCKSDSEMLDVDALQARMESLHKSGKNMSIEWRLTQIKKFHHMLRDNKEEIREALMKDLGRQANEAIACDIPILEDEAKYFMRNLKAAMKPKAVSTPLLLIPGWCYVEKRPLNSPGVLIIGPYNYPFRLSLQPFLGALAGGNPAVIKPSDFTPHSGALIKKLVETYFEPEVAQVVLGGVPETTALLAKKWGLVFFTGSERVGRIVQKACADTLTPTVLELGGKCPTIVDETVKSSHIQNVADRIAFAKLLNAGQTCIAPDTVFVHESHARAFGQAMVRAIHQQYGEDLKNGELARIVNKSNTKRIIDMIGDAEKSGAKVLIGGSKLCDPEEKYICPTLIVDPPKDSKIMQEEIFGPIAPIVTFQTRAEAIQRIQELPGEPLQLYVFTPSTSVFEEYTANCRSAAAFRNDALGKLQELLIFLRSMHRPHLCFCDSSRSKHSFAIRRTWYQWNWQVRWRSVH